MIERFDFTGMLTAETGGWCRYADVQLAIGAAVEAATRELNAEIIRIRDCFGVSVIPVPQTICAQCRRPADCHDTGEGLCWNCKGVKDTLRRQQEEAATNSLRVENERLNKELAAATKPSQDSYARLRYAVERFLESIGYHEWNETATAIDASVSSELSHNGLYALGLSNFHRLARRLAEIDRERVSQVIAEKAKLTDHERILRLERWAAGGNTGEAWIAIKADVEAGK